MSIWVSITLGLWSTPRNPRKGNRATNQLKVDPPPFPIRLKILSSSEGPGSNPGSGTIGTQPLTRRSTYRLPFALGSGDTVWDAGSRSDDPVRESITATGHHRVPRPFPSAYSDPRVATRRYSTDPVNGPYGLGSAGLSVAQGLLLLDIPRTAHADIGCEELGVIHEPI